jgi:CubicO group peptidase (beta-lactamase class C family)
VKPDTLFYAGSTTKSFTAAALSLLISKSSEYRDVDWTTPISSIIPEDFVLSDDWATKHITFEDALCHRSGYPRHDRSYGGSPEDTTLSSVVRTLRHLPMTAEPRTQWQYQNVMYVAISLAIEKLTGQSFKDFLHEQIWQPLGMKSTFFTYEDAIAHVAQSKDADISLAKPYLWIPSDRSNLTPLTTRCEGDHFAAIPYDLPPYVSGAGANITSVLDYIRYLDCMIRQASPIPKSGHAELRKQRMPIFDPWLQTFSDQPAFIMGPPQYALGWIYDVYAPKGTSKGGMEIWHHGGGLHGFNAEMRYIPALELGVVTLGNASPGSHQAGEVVFWEIVDNLIGVEKEARFDWKKENLFREEMSARDVRGKKDSLFGELASKGVGMTAALEVYEGVFENPGYAKITVSVAHRRRNDEEKAEPYLLVTASPRTWNFVVELTHIHEEIFMAEIILPYPEGEANANAGPGQIQDRSRALFKFGQNGAVQSFGIELDGAMVVKASKTTKNVKVAKRMDLDPGMEQVTKGSREKDEVQPVVRDWDAIEKGMIWFERVGEGN